jgi:hypothetical protein
MYKLDNKINKVASKNFIRSDSILEDLSFDLSKMPKIGENS